MKSKIFKKLIAGAATLAMVAQFGFVLPASAATNVYTQDFESLENTSTLGTTIAGNSTERIQSNVAGNSTKFYNVYVDGGSGDRKQVFPITPTSQIAGKAVTFSMKLKTMGSNTNPSSFSIDGDGGSIFTYTYGSYMGSPAMNGDSVTLTTANAANKEMGASNYASSSWLDVSVTVDFSKSPSPVKAVVKEGGSVVHKKLYKTSATNINKLTAVIGKSNGAVAYDDISIKELTTDEVNDIIPVAHTVTFNVDGVETTEIVAENGYATNFPDTQKFGYNFDGWLVNDATTPITDEAAKEYPITADTKFTAKYTKDDSYIEAMESVEFDNFPSGNTFVAGAYGGEPKSNPISVKITGEAGNNISANPDSRVDDYNVAYELIGFRWVASKNEASTDSVEGTTYCDGYAELTVDNNTKTADFKLTDHPFNYYGYVKATVTYNNLTKVITKPVVYIGNPAKASSNQILPRGGYISDFNSYSPDMVGYETTDAGNVVGNIKDIVTDNWVTYGGNVRKLTLASDTNGKYMHLETISGTSSTFATNVIDSVTDTQVMFDQKVRFNSDDSTIMLKSKAPTDWAAGATTFAVNFKGGKLYMNDNENKLIADNVTTGVWYRIVIASDVTSKKCYAIVYDSNETELGRSEVVGFADEKSLTPIYYMFRLPDKKEDTSLDFNDVKIYRADPDQSTFKMTATEETLAVPKEGQTAVTTDLTANVKTTEGYDVIGLAEWSVVDEPDGVIITPDPTDSHKATLTVTDAADAGDITVKVMIGGKAQEKIITLSSSQDSVKFTQSVSSISIPMVAGETETAEFAATVIDGDANEIPGKTVTYALYDQNNANPITVSGVTFEDGIMKVSSAAKPVTVWVKATSTNSNNETISKSVKVVIHGLAFDLGAGTAEDIADGYTSITPTTTYSTKLGYGIEGTAAAGGTDSLDDPKTDYLTGNFTLKVNVEKNKLYKVKVAYEGQITSEVVSTDLSGVVRTSEGGIIETEYTIPVFDDVLDLTFTDWNVPAVKDSSGNITKDAYTVSLKAASVTIEMIDDKTSRAKPNIYTVGDSTIANNGSWAYLLNRDQAKYTQLTDLASFSNTGRGGKNLCTYYTGGEFVDRVLSSIKPGDYVMIGDMGTNGMGSTFKDDFNYYIDCCLALGAKVILNSYSPHMAVSSYSGCYDSETNTFNGWRQDSYDVIVREIYEERKDELIGFVEIGKNADAAFNAYVADYDNNGFDSADAAAQAIIDCAGDKGKDPDHNHYGNSNQIAGKLMVEGYGDVKGIVSQLVDLLQEAEITEVTQSAGEGNSVVLTANMSGTGNKQLKAYIAQYTAEGILLAVEQADVLFTGDSKVKSVEYTPETGAAATKIFVWDSNMKPYLTNTTVTATNTDSVE